MEAFQRQRDAEFLADWEIAKVADTASPAPPSPPQRSTTSTPTAARPLPASRSAAETPSWPRSSATSGGWPGCGRASTRNQIDHTHEHARGGLTTPSNGGPACGRHNRIKTTGYTAHRTPEGTWHVHRPDGTQLTQPAAA